MCESRFVVIMCDKVKMNCKKKILVIFISNSCPYWHTEVNVNDTDPWVCNET